MKLISVKTDEFNQATYNNLIKENPNSIFEIRITSSEAQLEDPESLVNEINEEVQNIEKVIERISVKKEKGADLGIDPETNAPDEVAEFFLDRGLGFQPYSSKRGGTDTLNDICDKNISTLKAYKQTFVQSNLDSTQVRDKEVYEAKKVIQVLREYQKNHWSIGIDWNTLKPDHIMSFFVKRDLDFHPYIQKGDGKNHISWGTPSNYQKNIEVLEGYIRGFE